jgi:predicted kinase
VLPFYKVYRALIRAKVETLRSQDQQCSIQERQESTAKAAAYLRLARGLTLRPQLPVTLIMMCGLMGCGKTTLATALAYELGLSVIRSDLIRKELAGIAPLTPMTTAYGSGLYAPQQTSHTYAAMAQQTRMALQGNTSIIVDASFGDPEQRELFANLAAELSRPWYLFHLSGSDELLMERLSTRSNRGADASDGRVELYGQQKQQFSTPTIDAHSIQLDASRALDTLLHDVYQVILG